MRIHMLIHMFLKQHHSIGAGTYLVISDRRKARVHLVYWSRKIMTRAWRVPPKMLTKLFLVLGALNYLQGLQILNNVLEFWLRYSALAERRQLDILVAPSEITIWGLVQVTLPIQYFINTRSELLKSFVGSLHVIDVLHERLTFKDLVSLKGRVPSALFR